MADRALPAGRGDLTRARILAAARRRFAVDGYERATIRAIAADAGIDPALVMRYYGDKASLFTSAAEFDLRMPDLRAVPRKAVGAALVEHFLNRWEGDDVLKALLRTAATHAAAAEQLRDIFQKQIRPAIAALCGDGQGASTRAGLVASQMIGFALCRYVIKLPPVAGMRRAEVIEWLGPTIQRYIGGEKR
ncbi:MAG TPA: TetR family transcriptional regulator [Casimicrobiaceae bacterium]|jgi:AcrR family transcriptional regulator